MFRYPYVSGQFYEEKFDELDKQIKTSFMEGPGDLPIKRKDKKIYGILVPHAGYIYSANCQAWAYKEIAESKFPETYIILAPNHNEIGHSISISSLDWETPFGNIKNDTLLGKKLVQTFDFIKLDNLAHEREHSIEVQLPFLQFASKDNLRTLKILPISIKNITSEQIQKISTFLKNYNTVTIVSSDLTHFGPNYNYTPFIYNKEENIKALDYEAIKLIQNFSTKDFLKFINNKKSNICGYNSIALALEICKVQGSKSSRLLNYYTSSKITKDHNNSVSYASIIFE